MVEFLTWPENEKYDFDWNLLKSTGDKFAEIDYDTIQSVFLREKQKMCS